MTKANYLTAIFTLECAKGTPVQRKVPVECVAAAVAYGSSHRNALYFSVEGEAGRNYVNAQVNASEGSVTLSNGSTAQLRPSDKVYDGYNNEKPVWPCVFGSRAPRP
jgi:hypothetical protein